MKRKILIFFALAAFDSASFSQSAGDVFASLPSENVVFGKFVQTKTIKKSGKSLVSSGDFLVSPEGIWLGTKSPFPSSICMTKSKVTASDSKGRKKILADGKGGAAASASAVFLSIFCGSADEAKKNFSISFLSEGGGWQIALVPKDEAILSAVASIKIGGIFSEGAARLDFLEILDARTGDSTAYEFSCHQEKKELSPDEASYFSAD